MSKFPCCAWFQPIMQFPLLAARGVNTLIGYDPGPQKTDTLDAWCAAAKANGLAYWLQSSPVPVYVGPPMNLPIHSNDPGMMGWFLIPDEPNGAGNVSPGYMLDQYTAAKRIANRPVMLALDAGRAQQAGNGTEPYCRACDVVQVTGYPINYNGANNVNMGTLPTIIQQVRAFGKPVYACLECSDQNIKVQGWCTGTPIAAGMRGPTAAEMAQQAASVIRAGASGLVWFPQRIGVSFESYDGTAPDQQGAMTAINVGLNQ